MTNSVSQKLTTLNTAISNASSKLDAIPKIDPPISPKGEIGVAFDLKAFTNTLAGVTDVVSDADQKIAQNTLQINALTQTIENYHKDILTPQFKARFLRF